MFLQEFDQQSESLRQGVHISHFFNKNFESFILSSFSFVEEFSNKQEQ